MTLTQLTVFCELMKSGSIAKTARALGRSQPAISQAIKSLEAIIGFPLFEKQGRQLVAVPEAFYFLDEANEILNRTANLKLTMDNLRVAEAGSLSVATMPGPGTFLFPRFLSTATSDTKGVKISLVSRRSIQVYDMAASQSIDFGFADATQSQVTQKYAIDRITGRCFCALHANHELAKQKSIPLKKLNSVELGGLHANTLIDTTLQSVFQEQGYTYNKMISSQHFIALLQFIRSGQCIAVVDPLTVASERETESTKGDVVFRPILEPVEYEYAVITPSFRPMSRLAEKLKQEWVSHVMELLNDAHAKPHLLPAEPIPTAEP